MVVDRSIDYASGWFRVRDSLLDEFISEERFTVTLKVYLLLERRARRAGSGPGPRASRSGIVDLEVGQAVFGERELAEKLGLDRESGRKQIQTAIRNLERRGVITTKRTKAGTIATLIGYPGAPELVGASAASVPTSVPPRTPLISASSQEIHRDADARRYHLGSTSDPRPVPPRLPNETTDLEGPLPLDQVRSELPDPRPIVRADREDAAPPCEPSPGTPLPMPLDWRPARDAETLRLEQEARSLGVEPAVELDKLRDRGEVQADWPSRYRQWIGFAIKHARPRFAASSPVRARPRPALLTQAEERAKAELERRIELSASERTPQRPEESFEEWRKRDEHELQGLRRELREMLSRARRGVAA